jgi:uridine kinase
MQPRLTIGIAGSSGAGKGFVTDKLIHHYGEEDCVILSFDSYYFTRTEPTEVRNTLNFDNPAMLEVALLAEHVRLLKSGMPIECPTYDFATHSRTGQTQTIQPKPLIIIEGIFTLHVPELFDLLDTKIFIDTDRAICRDRRLKRDVEERGRKREDAARQFDTQVVLADDEFVRPSARHARVIIQNNSADHTVDISRAIQEIDFIRATPYSVGSQLPMYTQPKASGESAPSQTSTPASEVTFTQVFA